MMYFLNSALTVILAFFFFLIGILSLLIAWSSTIQTLIISLVQENFWLWFLLGAAFVLVGAALIAYTWSTYRKCPLISNSGSNIVTVSDEVINSYLTTYFNHLFPNQSIPFHYALKKRKIKIVVDLPFIPLENQKELVESIHNDLAEIMCQNIGYSEPVELSLSFASR